MATKKQKEELMKVLKFTPVTYTISLSGYGGEVVMGTVDRGVYDYFVQNNIDVEEHVSDWDNELEIPDEYNFCRDGSWYENDNLVHENGCEMSDACWVTVYDENGNEVWQHVLIPGALEDSGIDVSCDDNLYVDDQPPGTVVFFGQSFEKGTFFSGDLHLKEPFDHTKLSFSYINVEGWLVNTSVYYDGEGLDSDDYSTTGKSSSYSLTLVNDDGEGVTYEPAELPEGEENGGAGWPASYTPKDKELVKFKFSEHKPTRKGWYECNWGYGTTFGSLYWDGEQFVEFNYNKPSKISDDSIVSWTGLNWDTSDWANCPQKTKKKKQKKSSLVVGGAWPF